MYVQGSSATGAFFQTINVTSGVMLHRVPNNAAANAFGGIAVDANDDVLLAYFSLGKSALMQYMHCGY
jgi:hypothetical protein